MFEDINEANEHQPSKKQALDALAGVIILGNTPGSQIVQLYEDAALAAGALEGEVQAVVRVVSAKKLLRQRAQEGDFLIHSHGSRSGSERFSVWLLSEGKVSNDYTAFVCRACGLKLVERQEVHYTVVEGGGMDRAYDLADTIARTLGVPVTFQLRMGGPVKTFGVEAPKPA